MGKESSVGVHFCFGFLPRRSHESGFGVVFWGAGMGTVEEIWGWSWQRAPVWDVMCRCVVLALGRERQGDTEFQVQAHPLRLQSKSETSQGYRKEGEKENRVGRERGGRDLKLEV